MMCAHHTGYPDLLNRIMIVKMMPYAPAEMVQIIKIRTPTERISIADDALALLLVVSTKSSLRYAVQLLTREDVAYLGVSINLIYCVVV